MANIDDLEYKSISEMTTDEAIEHLRQIRLSRRIPVKSSKGKKKKTKALPKVNADQAAEILKLLGG